MIRFKSVFFWKLPFIFSLFIMLGVFSPLTYGLAPKFEVLQSFGKQIGSPVGKLVQDKAGNTYGVTGSGGNVNLGAVFRIDTSGKYTILHSFDGTKGSDPRSGVIQGRNGKFYGTTYSGGSNNAGTIYQLDISNMAPVYTVLHHFTSGVNGGYPIAGLLQGRDGKLYGTTALGGGNIGAGTIFQLDIKGTVPVYSVLHSFDGTNGWYPDGASLIQDRSGKLYGTTPRGGSGNAGTIFQLDMSGKTPIFSVVHHFISDINAGNPEGVILGIDDNLYGTTADTGASGGATAFRLELSGSTPVYSVVHQFDVANSGKPSAGIIQGSDGKLYGSTTNGGVNGKGTLFRLDISGSVSSFSTLYDFDGVSGATPNAGVIQGRDGKFYGTTTAGGQKGKGTVFQINANASTLVLKTLHNFDGSGSHPNHLIKAKDGNLYCATSDYLFKIDAFGTMQSHSVLLSFADVFYPFKGYERYSIVQGLIQGIDNKLYGIYENYSVDITRAFQLDISSASPVFKVLLTLPTFRSDSARPRGLIQANDGKFYGATVTGGISFGPNGSGGSIYSFDAFVSTPAYSYVHQFDGTTGKNPVAGVIQGKDAKLYGTAYSGGSADKGVVFQIDISGATPVYSVLHEFNGADGANPAASLLQANGRKFYGTTYYGGSAGKGTLFQLDVSGSAPVFTVLHEFDGIQGTNPSASLIKVSKGKFYGTTNSGGAADKGTVFQLDTSGAMPVYSVLHDFDGNSGTTPEGLVLGSDSNIYGTTVEGGVYGGGVIYRIKPDNTPINTPPVAVNDSYALDIPRHNKTVTIAAPGVLRNDKDAEGDKLSVLGATASKPRIIVLPKGAGKVELYANGSFTYTQAKDEFYGTRSFTYQLTDGKATSNPATVTLTIHNHH